VTTGVLRWREGDKGERKLRFKVLGEVTAVHRARRDRKTKKLRIPEEIQKQANAVLGIVKRGRG